MTLNGVSILHFFMLFGLILIALSLWRVLFGPSLFDRLTGLSLISSQSIIVLLLLGFINKNIAYYVDIALTYSVIGFVGPLILAKYIQQKDKPALAHNNEDGCDMEKP